MGRGGGRIGMVRTPNVGEFRQVLGLQIRICPLAQGKNGVLLVRRRNCGRVETQHVIPMGIGYLQAVMQEFSFIGLGQTVTQSYPESWSFF